MSDELEEKLMKIARSGSAEFIEYLEKHNIDLDGLKDIDIARKIVQERYSINDKEFVAVNFIYWISFFMEREAKALIVVPEILVGVRKESIQYLKDLFPKNKQIELEDYFSKVLDSGNINEQKKSLEYIIDSLSFAGKIAFIERVFTSKEDQFTKLMRKVKDLRNDIAHGRLENLNYNSIPLSGGKGQLMLITDLMNFLLKPNK